MTNTQGLPVVSATDLVARCLPSAPGLLTPLLAGDTAALVYGPAGIGKTFFALGLAWAVATGESFLGWQAPRPHRVLFVDAELGGAALRERLMLFGPPPAGLEVYSRGLGSGPPLDLSRSAGLAALVDACDHDLAVLDIGDSGRRSLVQRFVRHQKKYRRAVLMVLDANANGTLRGGTRRADDMDLVMALRFPEGAAGAGGARFEVHVEAQRLHGAVPPLVAALETDDAGARWRWGPAVAGRLARAVALFGRGLPNRQVAEALGMSLSALFRLKARARAQGLIDRGRLA